MSKFFKALQQAEKDHTLGAEQIAPEAGAAAPTVPPAVHDDPDRGTDSGIEPATPAPPVRGLRAERPRHDAGSPLDDHLVSLLSPASFAAEQYRTVRSIIERLGKREAPYVIAVSSPSAGDGKTTTAINIAGALAQSRDAKVLLIDLDLRGSSLNRQLNLGAGSRSGLVDFVQDDRLSLSDVLRPLPKYNLSVVPAGAVGTSPYEILKSSRMRDLMLQAREAFQFIVLDTSPLTPVADCRLIAELVDGFLVIVAAHHTPRRLVEESLAVIDPGKILGLVFNAADERPGRYYYGYGPGEAGSDDTDPGVGGRLRALGRRLLPRRSTRH